MAEMTESGEGQWRWRPARGLLAAVSIAALGGAHLYVGNKGWDYKGPLLLLDHLFDLAAVAALSAITVSVGRFVLARLRFSLNRPIEALTFGAAVGAGTVSTSILIIGFLFGLDVAILTVTLALWALLAHRELRELPGLISRVRGEVVQSVDDRALLVFGLLIFGGVTAFITIMALAPPVDWDALTYHLQVPAQFLARGRIYLPEDNLHTAYVGLVHMLYLPLLAIGSSSGPALFSVFTALLLGLAVFSLSVRFLESRTASLCLALLWGTTTLVLVAVTPRLDVTLALYLLLAHYALLMTRTSSSDRRHLFLAAALLGFAFGSKYHAVPYILGLTPLVLWVSFSRWQRPGGSAGALLLSGLILIVVAFPWLLKNWILLGSPVYPFLADTALEPWLIPLYGSSTVPPSLSAQVFSTLATARAPFNLLDAFLSPGRLTIEFEGAFHYANPIFLLLPLWVLFLRNKTINWLIVPAIAYLCVVVLPFGITNLRYLIPAAAPLTLAAVHMLAAACRRFLSAEAARLLLIALALLALVPSAWAMYAWVRHTKALTYLVGASSKAEYMATHIDPGVRTLAPLVEFVNQRLPDRIRILMLYEARGYHFRRPVIEDTRVSNWPLLAHRLAADDCLSRTGITHVLLNAGAVRYYLQRGSDPDVFMWDSFQRFAERCMGEPIYRNPAFLLFEIR